MTQYTDEIRTCIRPGCDNTFQVKLKGQTQLYCKSSCRVNAWHFSTPERRERHRQHYRDYYYRNTEKVIAKTRRNQLLRCECGQRKAAASDPMCADCAALGSVGRLP